MIASNKQKKNYSPIKTALNTNELYKNSMTKGVFLLPNLITSLSLLSGFYSIINSIDGRYWIAGWLIIASIFFDGYARASGKVGVVLVTSGPGATNTITGIATANMDSVPMVIITGQVPTNLIGNDAFQEADTVGITRPCTKHNYLVKDIKDLARTIKEAFYIASTGRPGPVLIDIPKDITSSVYEFDYPETVQLHGYNPTYFGHHIQIAKLASEILKAKKPLLYIGGGVISSNASSELLDLAELLDLPITSTLMGLGGFPSCHPLFFGMPTVSAS